MTKQQFIQEGFHTLLGIENKKFDLPQKSLINLGKEDCHVRISLKGEIDNDLLYYIIGGHIYELDVEFLRNQLLDESDYINTGFFKYEKGFLKAICVPQKYLTLVDIEKKKNIIKNASIPPKSEEIITSAPFNRLLSKDEFFQYVAETLKKSEDVLITKGKEYNRNRSWDESFRKTAFRKQKSILHVVDGYFDKHLESYYDLIEQLESYPIPDDLKDNKALEALIEEKLGDMINYMIIMKALMIKKVRGKL